MSHVLCAHPVPGRGRRGQLLVVRHLERSVVSLARTGVAVEASDYSDGLVRRDGLRRGDRRVAAPLEAAGIQTRRGDRTTHRVCPISGAVEVLEAWRNIKILPSVQLAQTSTMLRALRCFLDLHGIRAQMVVLSAGWVPLRDLGDAIQRLSRQISRLAARLRKRWQADLLFRSFEVVEHRDEHGEVLVHLHAHALLDVRHLPAHQYRLMQDEVRAAVGNGYAHFSMLEDPAEACKYAFKGITGFADDAIVELFRQTYRRNMYVPMGGFRRWLAQLEPHNVLDPATGRLRAIPARRIVRLELDGRLEWCAVPRGGDLPRARAAPDAAPATNVVVAMAPPSPWASPVMTPSMIVLNLTVGLDVVEALCAASPPLLTSVNQQRAIYNARLPPEDWAPAIDPRSPWGMVAYARRLRCELVERDGRAFLVSQAALDWDARARAAKSHGAHSHVSCPRPSVGALPPQPLLRPGWVASAPP